MQDMQQGTNADSLIATNVADDMDVEGTPTADPALDAQPETRGPAVQGGESSASTAGDELKRRLWQQLGAAKKMTDALRTRADTAYELVVVQEHAKLPAQEAGVQEGPDLADEFAKAAAALRKVKKREYEIEVQIIVQSSEEDRRNTQEIFMTSRSKDCEERGLRPRDAELLTKATRDEKAAVCLFFQSGRDDKDFTELRNMGVFDEPAQTVVRGGSIPTCATEAVAASNTGENVVTSSGRPSGVEWLSNEAVLGLQSRPQTNEQGPGPNRFSLMKIRRASSDRGSRRLGRHFQPHGWPNRQRSCPPLVAAEGIAPRRCCHPGTQMAQSEPRTWDRRCRCSSSKTLG